MRIVLLFINIKQRPFFIVKRLSARAIYGPHRSSANFPYCKELNLGLIMTLNVQYKVLTDYSFNMAIKINEILHL